MAMVGHQTEATYRRYAVVDEAMLREASAKLAAGPRIGPSDERDPLPLSQKDLEELVGRDGIEPPTPGFSVLCSTN